MKIPPNKTFIALLYYMIGTIAGFGIILLDGYSLKYSIAIVLAFLFFAIFSVVVNKKKFLLITLIFVLTFASADFFLGAPPPFHAGGAQEVAEINIVDIVLIFSILFLCLFKGSFYKNRVDLPLDILTSLALFILWCSLSIIQSDYKILGIMSLIEVIKISILWFFLAVNLNSREYIIIAVKVLLIGLVIQSIFGIYQSKYGFPQWAQSITQGDPTHIAELDNSSYLRIGGTIGWATIYAQYLILLIPLSFCLYASSLKQSSTLIYGGCTFLSLSALMLTLSRQGWVAIIFGLLIIFPALIKYGPLICKKRILIFIAFFFAIVIFFLPLFKDRIFSPDEGSAQNRLPMFKVAFNIISEHPIFGTGLNSYSEIMHDYDPEKLIWEFKYPVHNVYLFVSAEIGIPGVLFLLSFFISIIISLIKILKRLEVKLKILSIGLIGGLVSILIASLVSPGFKQNIQLWYIIMAYCGIATAIIINEKRMGF